MHAIAKVVSGGQTGVDRGALAAALELGIAIGGWCPPDRASEDGTIPEAFPLQPTPEERSVHGAAVPRSQRTEWNVRDSDGTLIVSPSRARELDLGTRFTVECAQRLGRPLLIWYADDGFEAVEAIHRWLRAHRITVLDVAGPSERTAPGIGDFTHALMLRVLAPEDESRADEQEPA